MLVCCRCYYIIMFISDDASISFLSQKSESFLGLGLEYFDDDIYIRTNFSNDCNSNKLKLK